MEERKISFVCVEVSFDGRSRHQNFSELLDFLLPYDFEVSNFYEPYYDGAISQYLRFPNVLFVCPPNSKPKAEGHSLMIENTETIYVPRYKATNSRCRKLWKNIFESRRKL